MKFHLFFLFFVALIGFESHASTQSIRIFTPKTLKNMLGPYPVLGSEEAKLDFDILKKYQMMRTEEECFNASKEEKATLGTLFGGKNGPLTKAEVRRLTPGFLKVYAEACANIWLAKKVFKRPRPYITDQEIVPCIDLEGTYAYPSGHTALARTFALILSRIYPERAEAFMQRGDEAALHRVLGGVHHPSDIEAGKKLGNALAGEILRSKKFNMLFND